MKTTSFETFDISPEVLSGIAALGWRSPTRIQIDVIPKILSGGDVIVQARTGTGKTGAFAVPIIHLTDPGRREITTLVLTPTRELALQVTGEIERIGKPKGVRALTVYGGDPIRRQINALQEGVQVVVGTPGRILDHLRSRTMDLSNVRIFVLDEADEMLSMGFLKEMTQIASYLPEAKQTVLCSATIPPAVENLAARYLDSPERVSLIEKDRIVPEIRHCWYMCKTMEKPRSLFAILRADRPESCIVFCNTRDEVRKVTGFLQINGVNAEMLSGELTQRAREKVMGRIKSGEIRIMVATDLAARGIDIQGLSHVFNYGFPDTPEDYIHRAGRTGRVGRPGNALSLVGGLDIVRLGLIKKIKGLELERCEVPTEEIAVTKRTEELFRSLSGLAARLPAGGQTGSDSHPAGGDGPGSDAACGSLLLDSFLGVEPDYERLSRLVLESEDSVPILSALLQHMLELEKQAHAGKAEVAPEQERSPDRGSKPSSRRGGSRKRRPPDSRARSGGPERKTRSGAPDNRKRSGGPDGKRRPAGR